ncbi:EamA family transporter [Pseudomonas sp. A46]|nr:EamA family transporter [Pseudomonas sp. A46]OWJ98126.1 EamA family transporter [Pseudomonas sp. A46]
MFNETDLATLLVLLSALMHAAWNAVIKSGSDRLSSMALVDGVAFCLSLALLPLVSPPPLVVWGLIGLSVVVNTLYRLLLIRAYHYGDFGQVYPVVRGLPPLLVALAAGLVFGERLSGAMLLGIVLISLGILSLLSTRLETNALKALGFAALAGVGVALYTLIDAQGVRRADGVLQFVVYLTLMQSMTTPVIAWMRRGPLVLRFARENWRIGLFGGFNYCVAYGLVLYAMTLDAVAKVAALRESSVIIAAIIASLVFKEPFGLRRILAACVVTAGILLIKMVD